MHRYFSQFARKELANSEWRIVVADNGSIDSTRDVAEKLSSEDSRVSLLHLNQKGRGQGTVQGVDG